MDIIDRIKKILSELIKQEHRLIKAVYLFGSFARGENNEKSDIDLAFVFDERFYKDDPFRAFQEAELLCLEINKRLHKTVDVVILNGSSLSFAYNSVKGGICIYERNTVDRILYEVTLDNKYQDFIPFIKELRNIKRRTLIGRN